MVHGPVGRGPHVRAPGGAVQVDPMKPKLKPPGTKRLKLKCDVLLSNFAFKFNLRHYIPVLSSLTFLAAIEFTPAPAAGAYTRPLLSST